MHGILGEVFPACGKQDRMEFGFHGRRWNCTEMESGHRYPGPEAPAQRLADVAQRTERRGVAYRTSWLDDSGRGRGRSGGFIELPQQIADDRFRLQLLLLPAISRLLPHLLAFEQRRTLAFEVLVFLVQTLLFAGDPLGQRLPFEQQITSLSRQAGLQLLKFLPLDVESVA